MASNTSTVQNYPSKDDIASLKARLRACWSLPPEIVSYIFYFADSEYSRPSIYVERNLSRYVLADPIISTGGYPAGDHCILLSPPIPAEAIDVHKVTFTVESHDRRWGEFQEAHGTSDGSWSWFEASIIRQTRRITGGPQVVASRENQVGPESEKTRWHVTSNLVAEEDCVVQEIIWRDGDPILPGKVQRCVTRGMSDRSREFVQLLQKGDRVVVRARAMFPGWTNFIQSASIRIFYSV